MKRLKFLTLVLLTVVAVAAGAVSASAGTTIAVMPFELGGTYDYWWYGTDEMLDGIAQRITDRLANMESITVVDRTRIDDILAEQDLQQSGAVDTTTAVNLGRLLGANIMVVGTLNDFGFKNKGGISFGPLSLSQQNANVKISARMISVETGQVLGSFNGEASDSATGISVDNFKGVSFGTDEFEDSVLGKALQKCIDDLMKEFTSTLEKAEARITGPPTTAKSGTIISAAGNYLILDVGSEKGVTRNTKFSVYHLQKIDGLAEPVRIPVGTLQVVNVDAGATVTSVMSAPSGAPAIQVGDVVEYEAVK